VQVFFREGQIQPHRVRAGDRLWKTDDPILNKRIRRSYEGTAPHFQRPVWFEAHGHAGVPLTLIARDELGHVVQAESSLALTPAEKHPLQEATLAAQLGRLGGTPFRLGGVLSRIEGALILPLAELNRMRREMVAALEQRRAEPKHWTLHQAADAPASWAHLETTTELTSPSPPPGGAEGEAVAIPRVAVSRAALASSAGTGASRPSRAAELIVLVRNMDQLEATLSAGVPTIYCEFEDPKKYREAVAKVRAFPGPTDEPRSIWVAPPRIFKPGEEWTLQQVRSCEADGYLVRNYDHLKFFAGAPRVGDFSLNVANAPAADYFKNRFGLTRLTASYDLNAVQLDALLRAAPPEWFEVTLHQHMPMFHMEHCVFCAFLSKGTDYTNCGRPCDRHEVRLRDRVGAEHVLKADAGCRNTVFNAAAQTGAEHAAHLLGLGVRHFRIEFLAEPAPQVTQTIQRYRQLLRGEITGHALWRELKLINQLGVTRGTLESR
jgi:putative protease